MTCVIFQQTMTFLSKIEENGIKFNEADWGCWVEEDIIRTYFSKNKV